MSNGLENGSAIANQEEDETKPLKESVDSPAESSLENPTAPSAVVEAPTPEEVPVETPNTDVELKTEANPPRSDEVVEASSPENTTERIANAEVEGKADEIPPDDKDIIETPSPEVLGKVAEAEGVAEAAPSSPSKVKAKPKKKKVATGKKADPKADSGIIEPAEESANDGGKSPLGSLPAIKNRMAYAVELECNEKDTRHWLHPWCVDAKKGNLVERPPVLSASAPLTIPECFNASAELYADSDCLGTRYILEATYEEKKTYWQKGDYEWQTFRRMQELVIKAGGGLMQLVGLKEKALARTCVAAILGETSAEWQISAQAAFQCGLILTTLYTDLPEDFMLHILNETEATILFIDWSSFQTLQEKVIAKCVCLEHIVLIGQSLTPQASPDPSKLVPFPALGTAKAIPPANAESWTLQTLQDIIVLGKEKPIDLDSMATKRDDLAFIMYTSGSTGTRKGVKLTHYNVVAQVASIIAQRAVNLSPNDIFMAHLPLASLLEFVFEMVCICEGAMIGYGHSKSLLPGSACIHRNDPEASDIVALRPTVLPALPSLLFSIKHRLLDSLKTMPGMGGQLCRGAVSRAQGNPSVEGCCVNCLLSCGMQSLMLTQVKSNLGLERLKLVISVGSPLAEATHAFASKVLAPTGQVYGTTETCCMTAFQEVHLACPRPADQSFGTVGAIQPACELKLVSLPDFGYLVTDDCPAGEILIAGNTLSRQGYLNQECVDIQKHPDGKEWFRTGDIGRILPSGSLMVIGRKAEFVKLAGGQSVILGKIEEAMKQVPRVHACIVFARPDKDHCVAIVSQPDRGWHSIGGRPTEQAVLLDTEKVMRGMNFSKHEIPRKVKIDDAIWTPQSGLVAQPSFKPQRDSLRNFYNAPDGLLSVMDYRFEQ